MRIRRNALRSELKQPSVLRRFAICLAAGLAIVIPSATARAAFHLWQIREIYTDSSGTYQFIELFCPSSGQTFVNGQQITVTPAGGGTAHTFTLNSGLPGGADSLNHALLFSTSSLQGVGAPAPNYTIPNGFLFAGGGTISFFGANSGSYTALPTDGTLSRTWGNGNANNSPQNFAGSVGVVVIPEPSVVALLALAGIGFGVRRLRRAD